MEYNRTILIEANSKNRINSDSSSADFEVQVPQITIPRGSTIELDGAIVQESSAANNDIIELSNRNISRSKPYTSSWTNLELRYYINNNGENSVCMPLIQTCGYSVTADDRFSLGQVTEPNWLGDTITPQQNIYVVPYVGGSIKITDMAGQLPLLRDQNDVFQPLFPTNADQWRTHGTGMFTPAAPTWLDWDKDFTPTPVGAETFLFKGRWKNNEKSGDPKNDGLNANDEDQIMYRDTATNKVGAQVEGTGPYVSYNPNSGGLTGLSGIQSALISNSPDSSKYTYMAPGYIGPGATEAQGRYTLQIYTKNLEINLENDLLETPDELAEVINSRLIQSKISVDDNLNQVNAYIDPWSTHTFLPNGNEENQKDLYLNSSLKEVKSITGDTLLNIKANFQSKIDNLNPIFSDGFFVKEPKKWIGGNRWLKLTNSYVGDETVHGIDPTHANGFGVEKEYIWRTDQSADAPSFSRLLPCCNAVSWLSYVWFFTLEEGGTTNVFPGPVGNLIALEANTHLSLFEPPPTGMVSNSNFQFLGAHPNGDPLAGPTNLFFTCLQYDYTGLVTSTYEPHRQYFLCRYKYFMGKFGIAGYRAVVNLLTGHFDAITLTPDFIIDLSGYNWFNKDFVNIYATEGGEVARLNWTIAGLAPGAPTITMKTPDDPTDVSQHAAYSGLPYYQMEGSLGGGPRADTIPQFSEGPPNYVWTNAYKGTSEYLCIPDGYAIPTNVKMRGRYSRFTNEGVQAFFRNCEVYGGQETEYKKQQADAENWYVELDVGLASDFNNALSNWLSSSAWMLQNGAGNASLNSFIEEWPAYKKQPPLSQQTNLRIPIDYGIYKGIQGYAINCPWMSNMMQYQRYLDHKPARIRCGNTGKNQGFWGFNFKRSLMTYQISKNLTMGDEYQTDRNVIRVYSRYFDGLFDRVKMTNHDMLDVDFTNDSPILNMHPSIGVITEDEGLKNLCRTYNIAIAQCTYSGVQNEHNASVRQNCVCLINWKPTFGRDGKSKMSYDIDTRGDNFRTCFRVLTGCPVGFDPAASTNPYCCSLNKNQSCPTNPMLVSKEQRLVRGDGTDFWNSPLVGDVKANDGNVYSARYQDYFSNILIGAVAPNLSFENSRMTFSELYTPRQFNARDAEGTAGSRGVGQKIAFFNENTHGFPVLTSNIQNYEPWFRSNPPGPGGSTTGAAPWYGSKTFRQPRNTGICDSLSGIGIENIYVRSEGVTNTLPHQEGVLKAELDINGNAINYDGSLFSLFGFNLSQFKPRYGKPFLRYDESNYGNITDLKYKGLSFFTLNSFINQATSQNLNIFGPNLPPASSATEIVVPPRIQGEPAYQLSYAGFQPQNILTSSDSLRGQNLPAKLQNAFYMIYSDLPNSRFITNNKEMNVIATVYRNWKSGSFYYSYNQSYRKTLTKDFQLTKIRTAILNSDGRPAEHLGDKVVCFYKITIPSVLPQLDEKTESTLNQNQIQFPPSGTPEGQFTLTPYQRSQFDSIQLQYSLANPVAPIGANVPAINFGNPIVNGFNGQPVVFGEPLPNIDLRAPILAPEIQRNRLPFRAEDLPEQKEEEYIPDIAVGADEIYEPQEGRAIARTPAMLRRLRESEGFMGGEDEPEPLRQFRVGPDQPVRFRPVRAEQAEALRAEPAGAMRYNPETGRFEPAPVQKQVPREAEVFRVEPKGDEGGEAAAEIDPEELED